MYNHPNTEHRGKFEMKTLIKWRNQKVKLRMDNNCHILDLVKKEFFSNVKNGGLYTKCTSSANIKFQSWYLLGIYLNLVV